jgi:hypothetical protein
MPYVGQFAVLIAGHNRVRTPKSEHHVGPFVHLSEGRPAGQKCVLHGLSSRAKAE